ncbi:MAG: glucuronate isomerase [Epulopiscium sp.]|nr:glucuronate isomerase [Candidatus Epulonipiscium sp.]
MKKFMNEDFLLKSPMAVKLYHDYAKDMPIFDYHCHLQPKEIWEDKHFKNITELWLYGDHYKWRAMRLNGIPEKYITGDADDYEKFIAWAKTLERCIGNPLYHWTHLELQRYFGIDTVLNEKTAPEIWEKCNEIINSDDFSARKFLNKFKVAAVGTTDDPSDSLEYHDKIQKEGQLKTKVLPTYRPDKAINIDAADFASYIQKLGKVVGYEIQTIDQVYQALADRMDYFAERGCAFSDHALLDVPYAVASQEELDAILQKALDGQALNKQEIEQYKTGVLLFLGKEYTKRNWAMQLHIGALRNNSTIMFNKLGPDTGYDSVVDVNIAQKLSALLNALEEKENLPKTILYTLNPSHNYVLATMLGNFSTDSIRGKMQFGSGWWFCDQKDGMITQMTDLANLGLLANFIGMLTDSRSFLSYPRHEYFRRILCNLIGQWAEDGEIPYDHEYLGAIVQDICFNNAKEYFGVEF